MANCTTCGNKREARWLVEGLCVGCSKKNSKTVINVTIASLTSSALKQLPQAQCEILPSDCQSMIGAKRQRELMNDENQHPQDGPSEQEDDNSEEVKQGEIPKRQKTEAVPQTPSMISPVTQERESNTPQQKQDQFSPSTQFNKDQHVVFVAHTDQQAIDLLKELASSDALDHIRAQRLQQICHMFSQAAIYSFFSSMNGSKLNDIMLLVQNRNKQLTQQQLIGIVMASIALGNACWLGSVKMLKNIDSSTQETVLTSLLHHLKRVFNQQLAEWLCTYWRVAEQPQLDLMAKLNSNNTRMDREIMTLSLITMFDDVQAFVAFSSAFVETAPLSTELIFACIKQQNKQQKLAFEDFLLLTDMLQSCLYDTAVTNMNNQLIATQICQWKELIIAESAAAKVANSSSVQVFLDELALVYGNISQFGEDATTQFRDFQILLAEAPLKPNDRQLGLAQYCIGKLYGGAHRQLWLVPSGHGKSLIMVSSAVLALMSGAVTKVHIVFTSKHLMKRDIEAFRAYWLLLGYGESQVEYHLGCNFVPVKGELIIMDEIDVPMFNDPIKFGGVIDGCLVMGFSATPDNFKVDGAEKRITNLLKFQKFHYMLDQQDQQEPDLTFDEVVACDSATAKAQFIMKQATIGPVLVYCMENLTEALKVLDCDPLLVTDDTDPEELQGLDKILDNGVYKVLVTHEEIAMRGFDYRSPNCQMTLIIDKSFTNVREAIQGRGRVGRWSDPCKRIRFSDVSLVDQKAQLECAGVLLRASLQLQKKPLQLKKIQVKKAVGTSSKLPQKRIDALMQQSKPSDGQVVLTGYFAKK